MRTYIHITGQIGSSHKLLSALNSVNANYSKGQFYSHYLEFESKKEAVKTMREGFRYMKRNDLEVEANRDRTTMYYDAAKAEVIIAKDLLK